MKQKRIRTDAGDVKHEVYLQAKLAARKALADARGGRHDKCLQSAGLLLKVGKLA